MRKQRKGKRKGRIYEKDPKNGRLYGDFRDLNGKCEALLQNGRATTDWDVAGILVAKRVKELEEEKRGIGIVGRGREETLENYALHHLAVRQSVGPLFYFPNSHRSNK